MSETQNSSHDSIDTSPLTLGQLADHELTTILSIERELKIMQAGASEDARNAKKAKSYLAPVQVRRPQVLLLDGARGTGKTSLLLTMAHWWNIHDGCSVQRPDRTGAQYQTRVKGIGRERLHFTSDGTIPTHIHPLRILDFDPLPPRMPLVAGIIQAWRPLAIEYDALTSRSAEECDGEVETLEDDWNNLFRVAAVGWSAMPKAKALLEQVLDRQEQVSEWQRLGQSWHEFVEKVIACGKCLSRSAQTARRTSLRHHDRRCRPAGRKDSRTSTGASLALSSQCRIPCRGSLGTPDRYAGTRLPRPAKPTREPPGP